MDDCIFCKIVKRDIPCYEIYRDEDFLVFLDIQPRNKGHCLVIPTKHYRWVWDVNESYAAVTNKIANGLKKAFDTDMVVSFVIGDEVPHAHIHLVPRFEGDGHGALVNPQIFRKFTKEEMQGFAEMIRKEL